MITSNRNSICLSFVHSSRGQEAIRDSTEKPIQWVVYCVALFFRMVWIGYCYTATHVHTAQTRTFTNDEEEEEGRTAQQAIGHKKCWMKKMYTQHTNNKNILFRLWLFNNKQQRRKIRMAIEWRSFEPVVSGMHNAESCADILQCMGYHLINRKRLIIVIIKSTHNDEAIGLSAMKVRICITG